MVDTIYDWLAYYAEFDPRRPAAVDLESGRVLDYGEFNRRATCLATGLAQSWGVRPGDRVAYLAHNGTDHFETMFACWKAGAAFVPLNWRLSPFEIGQILDNAAPAVVIHDEEFAPLLAGDRRPRIVRRYGDPGCAYEGLIGGHAPRARLRGATPDTVNMLLYTSGTTGRPKGVIYTHRMTMNIVMHAALHARVSERTRCLTYAPLFHAAGLNAISTPTFHFGGTLYVMRRWDARECLRHLTDPALGITHTVGVPTTYMLMSELPEFAHAKFPTLEVAGVGAAPVSLELLETWAAKGLQLGQSFGLTEVFSVAFCPPERMRALLGSAGHALMHVQVQIGDATGHELPRGTVGEIQVRGPGVTPGYWHDQEATLAAFTPNGWFHTGDAAYMTPEGVLYVVDRIKDLIITGGENVYPAEVENAIASLHDVLLVAVIGVPDEKWGEAVVAVVLPRHGAALDAGQVLARCRERLAGYKVPRRVEFVTEMPLSAQGKIQKQELRRRFGAPSA